MERKSTIEDEVRTKMLEGVIFINRPKEIGESIEKAEILFEKKTKRIYVPEFIIEKKSWRKATKKEKSVEDWKEGRGWT